MMTRQIVMMVNKYATPNGAIVNITDNTLVANRESVVQQIGELVKVT